MWQAVISFGRFFVEAVCMQGEDKYDPQRQTDSAE